MDAVVSDVVVLDGDGEPRVVRDLTVTQAVLARTLRRHLRGTHHGRVVVLARLVREESSKHPGQPLWVFEAPTDTDTDLARLYAEEHGDPFTRSDDA